jgi:hypothetical protein
MNLQWRLQTSKIWWSCFWFLRIDCRNMAPIWSGFEDSPCGSIMWPRNLTIFWKFCIFLWSRWTLLVRVPRELPGGVLGAPKVMPSIGSHRRYSRWHSRSCPHSTRLLKAWLVHIVGFGGRREFACSGTELLHAGRKYTCSQVII